LGNVRNVSNTSGITRDWSMMMWNVTRVPSLCLQGTECQRCQRTIVDEYSQNIIQKDVCGRACRLSRPCTVRVNISSQSSDRKESNAGSTGHGSPAGSVDLVLRRGTSTEFSMRDCGERPSRGGAGCEPPSHPADVDGERSRGGGDPASGGIRVGGDPSGPRQPDTKNTADCRSRSTDPDAGVLGAIAAGFLSPAAGTAAIEGAAGRATNGRTGHGSGSIQGTADAEGTLPSGSGRTVDYADRPLQKFILPNAIKRLVGLEIDASPPAL